MHSKSGFMARTVAAIKSTASQRFVASIADAVQARQLGNGIASGECKRQPDPHTHDLSAALRPPG